jgi:23S rRNA (uracil1939-C5)-methyltransferase
VTEIVTVTIAEMGRHGEGITAIGNDSVYVPYVLPGETVRIAREGNRGTLEEIVTTSAERIAPFCPAFTLCGGCSVQHWQHDAYRAWKRSLVETALRNRGIEAPVSPLMDAHGSGRRRVVLHARRTGSGIAAGFTSLRSHDVFAIDACPILDPALSEALAIARAIAKIAGDCDVELAATETGVDVNVTAERPLSLDLHPKLAAVANDFKLARLSLGGEPLATGAPPLVNFGRAKVLLPPAGFLQATRAGEEALAKLVLAATNDARNIADLFCGAGTFALRLAERARVFASDRSAPAVAALVRAGRHTAGLKPITVDVRNLARDPLMPRELSPFDAVVIDPPRSGAEGQAKQLARSVVKTIISVACDPATFARDAALLVAGDYAIESVTPVDQFAWTGHVEIVGVFRR